MGNQRRFEPANKMDQHESPYSPTSRSSLAFVVCDDVAGVAFFEQLSRVGFGGLPDPFQLLDPLRRHVVVADHHILRMLPAVHLGCADRHRTHPRCSRCILVGPATNQHLRDHVRLGGHSGGP